MKKLRLNKKVIASLSESEQKDVVGGLSSKHNCTGIFCCHTKDEAACMTANVSCPLGASCMTCYTAC